MADDKLSRFKILEKSRTQSSAAVPAATSPSGRFGALEKAAQAGAPAVSAPSVANRFGPQQQAAAPPPRTLEEAQQASLAPSGLELAQSNAADQPFVRCARCEMDNNSWSASCQSCGTNLNTEEQRVFNQKLWEKRRAEKEEEEKALAQAKAQSAASGIDPGTQRKLAEQIARDVAQSTRQRMDLESMRDSFSSGSMGYGRFNLFSWGFERLPPQVRTLLVVGALAVPLILMAFQRTRGLGFLGFFVVCIVLVRLWLTS